jgi:predicted lipase
VPEDGEKFPFDDIVLRLRSGKRNFFERTAGKELKSRKRGLRSRDALPLIARLWVSAAVASWQHQAKKHKEFRYVPPRFRLIQAVHRGGE